jgi:hypothetical protein
VLRSIGFFLIAILLFSPPTYAIGPEEAQEWLKGKNVPYIADEFVSRAAQGDIAVVNLFLDAGMDPDVKDKDGRTAMQVAIEQARGDIIKVLIEKGADRSPLISTVGDKDAVLEGIKSLGYITQGREYHWAEEHIIAVEEEDLPTDMAEALRFIERKGTAGSMTLFSPSMYNELKIEQGGAFGGLGIVISLDENKVLSVMSPIDGSPASRAGIEAGDKIIEINGESSYGLFLEEAVKNLRGPKGSKVSIKVLRLHENDEERTPEERDFTLIRDEIKIASVSGEMKQADIGYIGDASSRAGCAQ